jgi:CRISPR/Cas system CMR subunit Cmr6 (Cas7 group RAMP superfamily)
MICLFSHKYKYAKNVLLSLRSTDALLRFMFKNILNKESNVTKEELATYKKMNSLVKKINKKFKDHNFKDFEEFISYFNRKTDKVRTNDAYLLYEYFHQIFFDLYNKDTKNKLVKPRCFEAFKEANVFYDKTNNIEIIGGSD